MEAADDFEGIEPVYEEMPGWHDAKADVTGLWKMILGLFAEVWKHIDQKFIATKFLEFFYSSQLIDEDYLKKVASEIFKSKEYEDIHKKPKIHGLNLKKKAYEAPYGGG